MSPVPPKSPSEGAALRFWWVREGEQTRGPYTGKQMLAFLLKGRIRPDTPVRPDTELRWRPASEDPEFSRYFTGEPGMAAAPELPDTGQRMPNFIIMVDGDAYPARRIEAVLGELGPQYCLMPHIWLLQCSLQVEKIRTYLVRQLGEIERLFIVDLRTGTYACHKFGGGLEERIAALLKPEETEAS